MVYYYFCYYYYYFFLLLLHKPVCGIHDEIKNEEVDIRSGNRNKVKNQRNNKKQVFSESDLTVSYNIQAMYYTDKEA